MSYLDSYKKMLQIKGGSVIGSDIRNSESSIIRQFKNDKSYRLARYKKPNSNVDEEMDIRVINNSTSFKDKRINLLPNQKALNGEYVYFDDYWWLIYDTEVNLISPQCKLYICNQILHWKDSLGEHTYPCYSTNSAYGSKITSTNDYVPEVDTKDKIYVQYNEVTKNIDFGHRFMFNHSKKDIFKVTDFDSGNMTGLIILTCEKDNYLPEDDLENNLCYLKSLDSNTPINPTTYNIIGQDEIKQNIECEYLLDDSNCMWEIDEESLKIEIAEIISFTDNSCIVKASKQRTDEYFTLIAKDSNGNILAQKEIKSLVVR